ncbi:MAG: DUF1365 domain-containing protein [Gammaproteobacteria bacterium]|nr:DUF1365 domain-containing protein [Gammaproteobacteria bacterium]MDP2141048.1 DUF1365 domain-containing protein [Gammaproteobacteria bacterium]MDP2348506.1 DUF1365 domain-containing protein [Gammaproteobacteria bacterium]
MASIQQNTFKSAIFEGSVRHRRFSPKPHEFTYKVFMMYLDLTELDRIFSGAIFWSARRFNLAWFRRSDYMSPEIPSLDTAVRRCIENATGETLNGPIRLLTNLRYFGYLINPISCYYCFDDEDNLRYIVAEVTNTPWHERIPYVIPCESGCRHQSYSFSKQMHVSPFMPMDMTYHWQSRTPATSISIHLQNWKDGTEAFNATVGLRRVEITPQTLNRILLRHPFMTAKVGLSIYWQALKLLVKRIPYFGHSQIITGEKLTP